jgi:hypothetical protein
LANRQALALPLAVQLGNKTYMMLSHEREQFSEIFYRRHRKHVIRVMTKMAILVAIAAALAGINVFSFFCGKSDTTSAGIAASVFLAIFLLLAWASYRNVRNLFQVRALPYFERPIGQKNTWLAGEGFLWHSRQLDEIAVRLGVRRLSEFSSGDDMVRGEELEWFAPEEALKTVERLLQPDTQTSLTPAVVSDLTHIRDALRLACSQSAKFCFLIREGPSTSGLELERRKGSFF